MYPWEIDIVWGYVMKEENCEFRCDLQGFDEHHNELP